MDNKFLCNIIMYILIINVKLMLRCEFNNNLRLINFVLFHIIHNCPFSKFIFFLCIVSIIFGRQD